MLSVASPRLWDQTPWHSELPDSTQATQCVSAQATQPVTPLANEPADTGLPLAMEERQDEVDASADDEPVAADEESSSLDRPTSVVVAAAIMLPCPQTWSSSAAATATSAVTQSHTAGISGLVERDELLPAFRLPPSAFVEPSPSQGAKPDSEPIVEEPALVMPTARIGSQPAEASEKEKPAEAEASDLPPMPEPVHRLPVAVANIPAPLRTAPHDMVQPSADAVHSDTNRPNRPLNAPAAQRDRVDHDVDDSWRDPETLLATLKSLADAGPTGKWASEVIRQIRALGPAVASNSNRSTTILKQLEKLSEQVPQLAAKISDKSLARKFRKANFALERRLDVWQGVVRLGVPQTADTVAPNVDPRKLALCLAKIDSLTGDSAEGRAWREYLLVDALEQSSKQQEQKRQQSEDDATRQLARRVLVRLTQTPMTPYQQQFVSSGPVAALRAELRRWAAEPVGAAAVLRAIEDYERTGLPSDARRLALDCQSLAVSSVEGRRQLAESIDRHYRNASVRIAVTEELLNRLIPERNLEYAQVADTVLGNPVRGESLMATELAVRMIPDAHRVRLALEVTGEIAAQTTADAGPARFHNDSESYYIARKPLEIDMHGISVWPVEVGVRNETRLRGVETPLDGIPLIASMGRWAAKAQMEQNKPAATEEVEQKVAAQARQRIDTEVRQRLTAVVATMNQRVFDPLNSLSLDPQLIEGKTTEKRFVMRLRLAGEDQLGSHTPRPQAPGDSLASVQIHESVLNNGIERLQLNGRTFSLPELSEHIARRLNRPAPWEINPEHADVKITFAEKDAVVVRCQDGQLVLTLSIVQLSKSPRKWKNFQIQAFYRPEVDGRSAQLAREGVIYLIGKHLNLGSQIALRGIFSRALSKNNAWNLVPEQIVKEPKLANAAITQFVIDDGWIGVALGPKRPAATTVRRQRWGLW